MNKLPCFIVALFAVAAAGVLPAASADISFLENAREIAPEDVSASCMEGRYQLGGLRKGTPHKHEHYMIIAFDAEKLANRWISMSFKAHGTGRFQTGVERSLAEKVFSTPLAFHPALDMPFCCVFGPVKQSGEKKLKIEIVGDGCAELWDFKFHVFDSEPQFAPEYPSSDGRPLPEGYVSARELPLPEISRSGLKPIPLGRFRPGSVTRPTARAARMSARGLCSISAKRSR